MTEKKVAIVTTGGYYFNWTGGSKFYEWLYTFCSQNKNFVPHIVSWQPESNVPEAVKSAFKGNIHYRDNNGCDWGCYNFFVDYLQKEKLRDEYDYIIFCHDDILSAEPDWPAYMIEYAENNKNFDLVSFGGAYHELPNPAHVDSSNNRLGYYKSFDSMCFCCKVSDKLFKKNPFVTIPGHDQDQCGDSGCTIVLYNILNLWGADSIGIGCSEGVGSNPEFFNYILKFKRGSTVRRYQLPSKENIVGCNIPDNMLETHQVIRQGWKFIPGKRAYNDTLGID